MTALMKAALYSGRAKEALITRDKWIVKARNQGFTLRRIAQDVSMSPAGVAKVIERTKPKENL